MKRLWQTTVPLFAFLCAAVAVADPELLRDIAPGELSAYTGKLPEGSVVQVDEAAGELRLTFSVLGPASFPLFEVPLSPLEHCRLEYRAEIGSENLQGTACIELLCEFAPGEQYFSRALDAYARGTTEMRPCATPFFLQAGQRPQRAWLGVYAEGSGTVVLRKLSLWRKPLSPVEELDLADPGAWWGITGGVFGGLSGVWGTALALLAWKGRARRFALGTTWCYMVFGLALLVYGGVLVAQGGDWWRVFPPFQLGALALVLGASMHFVLRWRYRAVEEQRMAAIELSELRE